MVLRFWKSFTAKDNVTAPKRVKKLELQRFAARWKPKQTVTHDVNPVGTSAQYDRSIIVDDKMAFEYNVLSVM